MKITVNEQAQRFYLATNRWEPVVGHEIKVGKYKFCAIPLKGHINVSEVTSGCKLFNIPMNFMIMLETGNKEGTMNFLIKVGESIKRIIDKQDDFDRMLEDMKTLALDRLGKMPPVENVDTNWLEADISDVLN